MSMEGYYYTFGPHKIDAKDVFYTTQLSFAMVNLRPALPDVLIIPKREVKRVADLTAEETCDLWLTAQKVGRQLESYHKSMLHHSPSIFKMGLRLGRLCPMFTSIFSQGRLERNDDIYEAIDEKEKELKRKLDIEKGRKDRSSEGRIQEANAYRSLFL